MTDQELADAIRQRFPNPDQMLDPTWAQALSDLLIDNPPWTPKKGEPCWCDGDRVEYHGTPNGLEDVEGRRGQALVWFVNHRYRECQWVDVSSLSPRETP